MLEHIIMLMSQTSVSYRFNDLVSLWMMNVTNKYVGTHTTCVKKV